MIEQRNLAFPFQDPPAPGQVIEVAAGILWARLPLPYRLNHINIYFIDDGDGWAILDTGIGDDATRAAWEALVAGPLRGRRLTRLIVTHHHPDHIGLAGWLCEKFGLPLLTSQTSYLGCLNISLSPEAFGAKAYREFYQRHGLGAATTEIVSTLGHDYLKKVTALPLSFNRLVAGDSLNIGGRTFSVLTGDGHAPEQVMLYCVDEKLFLAADQVLARISPNVSVWAVEPEGDPLGLYLRSLRAIKATLSEDAMVLPGHQLPFKGLPIRIGELIDHHRARCAIIAEACRESPKSAADLLPVLFNRQLDPHQTSFAFSEILAHVNYMMRKDELAWAESKHGVRRMLTV